MRGQRWNIVNDSREKRSRVRHQDITTNKHPYVVAMLSRTRRGHHTRFVASSFVRNQEPIP